MPKAIQELTALIAELPGLGPRQARRIVQHLLHANTVYKQKLTEGIHAISTHVAQCTECFRYDEVNGEKQCRICADKTRDNTTLMVVEKDVDAEVAEESGVYRGRYFILGSLMPLGRQRKSSLPIRTEELLRHVEQGQSLLQEVILAFATTPEGDYTAHELKEQVVKMPDIGRRVKVTILGRGLSLGAEIEYADQETLRSALRGRREEF